MKFTKWIGLYVTAAVVLVSGCSNSMKAPSLLRYGTARATYTRGVAISANTPTTSGGKAASYAVIPDLPAGLSLGTSTGVISGTPTAVTPTAGYNVTASSSDGSATATLVITVNDRAPAGLAYSAPIAVYTDGVDIAANDPSSTGGAVASYSVSPDLPAGLNLDPSSGQITGAPTRVTAMASYTVTATNATGNTTAALTITVMAPPPQAQLIPNLNQLLTPLAPFGSSFMPLMPGGSVLADYPDWQAGQAVSTAVSPDGTTLLILTSGFNRIYNAPGIDPGFNNADGYNSDYSAYNYKDSQEYVFIYDIANGAPVKKGVVTIPNAYHGIVWDSQHTTGGKYDTFYVSGGSGDYPLDTSGNFTPAGSGTTVSYYSDEVHIFQLAGGSWTEQSPPLLLNHSSGRGLNASALTAAGTPVNAAVAVLPLVAGIAISSDGQTLVAANYFNDSITMFSGGYGNWNAGTELDLWPADGSSTQFGTPGGTYPFWVVIQGTGANATGYVSSIRDREIDVVSLGTSPMQVIRRIHVKGEPNKMTMNKAQTRLYVAEDMTDTVDVIDIAGDSKRNTVLESIPVLAPRAVVQTYGALQIYKGANTNSVTLSPDESQLYVTDGNLNAVAVVALNGTDTGDQTVGLIPTGWYPNSVSFGPTTNSPNGNWVYVINGKSPTGPNSGLCYSSSGPTYALGCFPSQQYNPQLTKAGFQSFPQPTVAQLATLTARTVSNNHFAATESASDAAIMAAVRAGVQHVIYILKENRSYDQVLGDLPIGNGDPGLTEFGEANTPSQHKLAMTFVTLDNMMASAEVSETGWQWSTAARSTDIVEHQFPLIYSGRGAALESGGQNRYVGLGWPDPVQRTNADPLTPQDGNLFPGSADVAAPDGYGPNNAEYEGEGHLWDAAGRAHLSIRNYGFFVDSEQYTCPNPVPANPAIVCVPLDTNPFDTGHIQAYPTSLAMRVQTAADGTTYNPTDPYFRGFDNQYPDYYRFQEWLRDFNANYAAGGLPALSLVRLMHDHTGNFNDPGNFGLSTPQRQQADNDYAVGLVVQTIANSPVYKNNTLIFVIEDDSQDAGDHMDSHRTIAFVAGAYVKQGALISTPYTTINFLRTMEEVLGIPPNNINDALARPMADIFNTSPSAWTYTAVPSGFLYCPTETLGGVTVKPVNLGTLPSPHAPCPETGTRMPTPQYWIRATRGMDFTAEDRFDFEAYNHVLWKGIMGNRPYPERPTGKDLRANRKALLARYRQSPRNEQLRIASVKR
jgi:hypothetical protein